ncbi:protein of unknown function [Amphibacillus marinus]|uniref:DUF4340 domain-containing protein n=1 Tax=Amphibacillus marinus TaxID=872970 RepID=A0A1H8QEN9_9BACI|nr:DUF4340 domain-containing protein [Amphibacillus marinus]SEO52700.1 protein of unknown function [Amphibacillus marinus]
MKKVSKNIAILTLIIAVLIGLYYVIGRDNQSETTQSIQLINDPDAIVGLTIHSEQGFSVVKTDQIWQVEERSEATHQERTTEAIERLSGWEGEAVELQRRDVGLDFPSLSLTVSYQNGEENRLMIGQLNNTGTGYYIEDRSNQGIYLVDRALVEAFPFHVQTYLDTQLFSWQTDRLQEINIFNGIEEISLHRNSPYPEEETRANITGWFINKPYTHFHHTTYSIMEVVLQATQIIAMDELVEENATDLSKYGLDDSNFTISFITDDSEELLLIGSPATQNSYYAMFAGSNRVFTITNDQLEPFSYQSAQYHDGYLKIIPLDVMDSLEISSGDYELVISIENEGESALFTANNQELSDSEVREAYKSLAGLRVDGVAEDIAYQDPDLTVTYQVGTENNTKQITLDFISYDDEHYAVFMDAQSDFIVEKQAVNQMLIEFETLIP